jgi:CBS domain-containing protein
VLLRALIHRKARHAGSAYRSWREYRADGPNGGHAMKAADIMVPSVISVSSDATVQDVAQVLLKHRISGVPVVDAEGRLVGIVSEGDLMRRPEAGTLRRPSWWLTLIGSKEEQAFDYIKSHSRKVADVMTQRVVTASPDTPVGDIATLLEKHGIKRVPIVKDGKVVGIVSRANLLQALACLKSVPAATTDDESIRAKLNSKLEREQWTKPSLINVIVHEGTVDVWGIVDSQIEKKAVRVLVESTPGVRAVNDNLIIPSTTSGWY